MTKQVMKLYSYIRKAMSGEMCNNIFNSGYNLGMGCQFTFYTFLCLPYCFHFYCFVLFSVSTLYPHLSKETESYLSSLGKTVSFKTLRFKWRWIGHGE